MTRPTAVNVVIEGASDAAVIVRLLTDHGFGIQAIHGYRGKSYIDAKLLAFNAAAKFGRWLVLRDLDRASCAAALRARLLPTPAGGMRFRVAVRCVESWLLADAKGIVEFLRVPAHAVPAEPEKMANPKRAFVELARRSTNRSIREDVVPEAGSSALVGPGYVARINEFAQGGWSWRRAATRSDSLRRCIASLGDW